ncbi:MAG TPA: hypothetical protein VMH28_19260 [Candidatus Acidoferrales bacterium]|nr:hypothetical protein [Candidatus Acidoferrales bacterium]
MAATAGAIAQPPCPMGSVGCKREPPPTGPSCGVSLTCASFSVPNAANGLAAGHYVGVHVLNGTMVSSAETLSIDYTLKYTGGCEASGGTLKIRLEGDGFVRLEDKPWWAPCTNLVPLTFEATVASACGCRVQVPAPASGPDTCRVGYVWREACGLKDRVCVEPKTRDETAQENQLAASRVAPNKDTCKVGYVWREACGSSDHVCVTPESRTRARNDNAAAPDRVAHFLGQ